MMVESRFDPADSQLVADLHRLAHKSPTLVRSTVYPAPSDPAVEVRSWKMNEFKYYDVRSPFPTLARGLFTRELKPDSSSGAGAASSDDPPLQRYQIVARGYDKFFNIGEVPWTDWSSLEAHTGPDYTLSVKSNGCIIFVAAISPSDLVVASKHALGEMEGVSETHAQAGHRWLKTHLASKGKTERQLAAALWEKNWTAVAELCDDDFEEHVLPYPPDKSGLYLHGINETRKDFYTLPTHVVDGFAEEWGFLKTTTVVYNTLTEVKEFTDEVARTGKWKGEPIEGFVVRTRIVDNPKPGSTSHDKRPPYPPGSSFFFKVKFEEPYMMYRDWREITKSLLSAGGSLSAAKIPQSKLKRKESQMYLKWVKKEIRKNRSAFEGYAQGKGIIATRERFLKWVDVQQGKKDLSEGEESDRSVREFGKTIIMLVAVPGCGKTSVAVALAHLFGFGHTQSDDVQGKRSASVFIKNVVNLLREHDVVIADKNNHLRLHREALREAIAKFDPPVRLLALNWTLDLPQATIARICGGRILERGDNHQTLHADSVSKSHEEVVWRFVRRAEDLANSEVDASITMDVGESLDAAVVRAVDGCVDVLGLERPSQEAIDEAVEIARAYEPATRKETDKKGNGKGKDKEKEKETETETEKKAKAPTPPRYFAILAKLDIEAVVVAQMEVHGNDVPEDGRTFWRALVDGRRVTEQPHVTIVHKAGLPADADLWERCTALERLSVPQLFEFRLGYLVWNERVMALTVQDLELAKAPMPETGDGGDADKDAGEDPDGDPGQEKHTFLSMLPVDVRESLHITVGTRDADIPPYEAKGLVEAWQRGKRDGIGALALAGEGVLCRGRLKGLIS